jgi:hypothetical protein
MADPSSVDEPETKKDEDIRELARDALKTRMFDQLFYCDECKDIVGVKLPKKKPMTCVFKGWFVDSHEKKDYCRTCMVKWLEGEGIPAQDSPLSFNARVTFIHDLDQPGDLCVFCEEMSNLQQCSKCYVGLVARTGLGSEEYDELMPYYFDDRRGRITEGSFDTQATVALIEEALASGNHELAESLLVSRLPTKNKNKNEKVRGEDLPICKHCWYRD